MKYYAYYADDGLSGIVETWEECKRIVYGGLGFRYKKFNTHVAAEEWIAGGGRYNSRKAKRAFKEPPTLEDGIYCDAGTGRGIGVEFRITDRDGNSLVPQIGHIVKTNKFGNGYLGSGFSNNYGELMAVGIAIPLAKQLGINKIFSDSKLVLDYWSRGICKSGNEYTQALSRAVAKLRTEFESDGGALVHVSGDYNPADLGFHRKKY